MKKLRFQRLKIDWPNHVIGFFSALFGILIAFELDEWRERNNQREMALTAFERMKSEIDFNRNILHANVKQNLELIQVLNGLTDQLNDRLLFTGSRQAADSINQTFPGYIFIETEIPDRKTGYPVHIGVGSMAMISLHTSAWESAKATGVLNFMDYEKVIALSSIYNYSTIVDELLTIRQMTRKADDITSKAQLLLFLSEAAESLNVIERELAEFDQFVNILKSLD
jgi:hypothetical protein